MTNIKRSFGFYFCKNYMVYIVYMYLTRLIIMRQDISFLFATCFNCRALYAAVIIIIHFIKWLLWS